ncbi:MAG: alkaline phosphatase family protein, partial [bacterium]
LCRDAPSALRRSVCYAAGGRVSRARPAVVVETRGAAEKRVLVLRAGRRAPGIPSQPIPVAANSAGRVVLTVPKGVTLRGGPPTLAPGDERAVLWPGGRLADSTLAPRRLTWITLRGFDQKTGRATFHVGGTAVNVARPLAFRLALDRAGIIRPAPADETGLRRGQIDEHLFVRTALRELDAAVALARHIDPRSYDLATIYLAAVDSMGHTLLAPKDRKELAAEERARFHRALEQGLRQVDQRLGLLLDALDLRRTRVLLASDHGMIGIHTDVSLRAAVQPIDRRIQVVTSAGSGFLHLPQGVDAQVVRARLLRLTVDGRRVFEGGRVAVQSQLARLGLPDTAADLFVQAGPGFSLSSRRLRRLTAWPRNLATHGLRSDDPRMHGIFLAAGPGISKQRLGLLQLTQVAAAVADALGIRPPKGARPGPPNLWSKLAMKPTRSATR